MADAVIDRDGKGIAASRPYLAQGAAETMDSLKGRYAGLLQQSNFGGGEASPLANKIAALRSERLNDIESELEREMPLKYADRQMGFQGVSSANQEVLRQEELARAQAMAAKKAKRMALISGGLGLAGAAGGAMIGGPAGAMVGAGAGQMLGSQLG